MTFSLPAVLTPLLNWSKTKLHHPLRGEGNANAYLARRSHRLGLRAGTLPKGPALSFDEVQNCYEEGHDEPF